MSEFKNVLICDIHPDPNQPRKFYDETAMQELTVSVKEKGVLQPILIRPNGKGYILVCGERRYKASQAAGKEDIPAVIRQMSDEEALELQIIENLQRKDVHAMEEAVAFKSLLENKNRPITIEDVAAKVGKTVYYVRQRVKLNSLTKAWQEIFYANKISISGAFQVAQLAEKEQDTLYNNGVQKKHLKDPGYIISITDWQIRELRRELKEAPFDTKDETLNPKMGACTTCPFNTAVASLFPEAAKDPICNNASCFTVKAAVTFDRKVKEVADDPSCVFFYSAYNSTSKEENNLIQQLKKEGHKVYKKGYGEECEDVYSPSKTDIETGKVLKAFELTGYKKGKFSYIKLLGKGSSASSGGMKPADKIKSGKAKAEDIDAEIKRIKEREMRSKELDAEKVHGSIVQKLKEHKNLKGPGFKYRPTDRLFLLNLVLDAAGYSIADNIRKAWGVKPAFDFKSVEGYKENYFFQLQKVTDDQLAYAIRMILLDKNSTSLPPAEGATSLFMMAKYMGVDIEGLSKDQSEIAKKRNERITSRIAGLVKLKGGLAEKKASKEQKKAGGKPSVGKRTLNKKGSKAKPKK
jgi:ParB family chromosome partitioning protein